MMMDFSKLSSSDDVGLALEVMRDTGADCLLVEEKGEIKGIVTSRKLAGYPSSRLIIDCTIEPAGRVSGETLLDEALSLLKEKNVNFLVILDRKGMPLGVANREIIISSLYEELEKSKEKLQLEIQERKQAQEEVAKTQSRLEHLLVHTPAVIYSFMPSGNYSTTFVSENVTVQLGYEPSEFIEDSNFWPDHIHPEDSPHVLAELPRLFEYGHHSHEYRFLHKDGAYRWLHDESRLVRDAEGNPLEIVGYRADITEHKLLEKQLYHAQKMEAVGTLASGIAHELNNSLAAIQGYAQLLVTETGPDYPLADYVRRIKARCQRASVLTRKVLTHSRMDIGKKIPVNVNDLMEGIRQLLRQTLPPQIDLESELPGNLPDVMAEPTQLEQVFLNLGMNARDAIPHGGKIRFTTRLVEQDERFCPAHFQTKAGRYVAVTVEDTGEGMPPEVLERIFDPFFTTKEPGKGTGLGLSIVYSIIKNYGGYILAESQAGQGSRFLVYLPVMEGEQQVLEVPVEVALPRGTGESVLVVDDDPQVREIIQKMLESNGYRVALATHGEEALAVYQKAREMGEAFDLVLLDLVMPVMDGETCLERLQEMDPQVQVIVMTGNVEKKIHSNTIKQGAHSIILKPFDLAGLVCEIKNLIKE